jgi:HlyD family secretion protein
LGVLALVFLQIGSWWQQRLKPRFLTAKASRGRVETVVNSTGTVKPVRSVTVGAFTSGPIKEVFVDYNAPVTKGMRLALIDDKLLKAALDRDRAAVDTAWAAVESQKADLDRVKALYKQAKNNYKRACDLIAISKDYLAETDLDQYFYTLESLEAQMKLTYATIRQGKATVRQAQANLKNSEDNREYAKINSPEDGIVIDRKVDPGQTVAASFQTPELFTIAPEMEKHMYVFASVDEADIGQIRAAKEHGRAAKFTVDAYAGFLFEGSIFQIRYNSSTVQNVVTYPVVIDAPNPDLKLMPGMTANITFQIEGKENVLRIPVAALRYVPPKNLVWPEDQHYLEVAPAPTTESGQKTSATDKAERVRQRHERVVWVQDGDLLRAIPVKLGMIENQFAEVVSGQINEGQELVTGTESGR